jgi:adenosylmethionine-8-amino-7-oxononanoate aminotransferase
LDKQCVSRIRLLGHILKSAKGINLYFSIEFTKNEEGDTIMISPPYNIGEVELFEIFDKLDKVFQEFSRRLKHACI